jgi:putative endonuclease
MFLGFEGSLTVGLNISSMANYSVYVLCSNTRRHYVGVTNDLRRRIYEHNAGLIPGFTARYRINQLVYFELTPNILAAISREKEIKGWSREKKFRLIESTNLGWIDLAADWFSPTSTRR